MLGDSFNSSPPSRLQPSQDGNELNYKTFLYKDLVQHLKPNSKKRGKKSSYLALNNLKDALKHMKSKGLFKIKS